MRGWILLLTLLACAKKPDSTATMDVPTDAPEPPAAAQTGARPTCPPKELGPHVPRDGLASWTSDVVLSSGITYHLTAAGVVEPEPEPEGAQIEERFVSFVIEPADGEDGDAPPEQDAAVEAAPEVPGWLEPFAESLAAHREEQQEIARVTGLVEARANMSVLLYVDVDVQTVRLAELLEVAGAFDVGDVQLVAKQSEWGPIVWSDPEVAAAVLAGEERWPFECATDLRKMILNAPPELRPTLASGALEQGAFSACDVDQLRAALTIFQTMFCAAEPVSARDIRLPGPGAENVTVITGATWADLAPKVEAVENGAVVRFEPGPASP